MNIAVTGGVGFIGSRVVALALEKWKHAHIVVIDKFTYASSRDRLAQLPTNRVHVIEGDIRDMGLMVRALRGVDVLIHTAAETHVDRSLRDAVPFFETNVLGTWVVMEAARSQGVKKIIHMSTDEVYGDIPQGVWSREADILNPSSPYAASKASSDLVVHAAWHTYHIPVVVSRCTNNYGPFQHPEKFIPLTLSRLLAGERVPVYGDGAQVRDWLYVDDHVEAIFTLISKGVPGEVYNIGAGNVPEMTNNDIVRDCARLCGRDDQSIEYVEDRLGHDRRYAVDTSKMRALGWSPAVEWVHGVASTAQWYNQHIAWTQGILKTPHTHAAS